MIFTIFEKMTKPKGSSIDRSFAGLADFFRENIVGFSKKSQLKQFSSFKYANDYRSSSTAISASSIVFDVDNDKKINRQSPGGVETITLRSDPYLCIDEAQALIEMCGCEALIYTTPSHHEEHNKFRIIVPLSREITVDEYEECAYSFLAKSGLDIYSDAIDSCFRNVSQAYYIPARRLGSKKNPDIIHVEGKPFVVPKATETKKISDLIVSANNDMAIEDDWWKQFKGDLSTLDILALLDVRGLRYGDKQPSGAIPCDCPFDGRHKMKAYVILPGEGKGSGKWPIIKCSTERCSHNGLKDFLVSCGTHTVDSYCAKEWKRDITKAKTAAHVAKMHDPSAVSQINKDGEYKMHTADIAAMINKKHKIIRSDNGSIFEYNGSIWEKINKERIRSYAQQYDSYYHSTKGRREEATDFLLNMVHRSLIPWNSIEKWEVAFRNGVYNILSGDFRPHEPDMFLNTIVPHDFIPGNKKAETFESCLNVWFEGEYLEEKKQSLQEYFGYVLMQEAKYKKALVLYGSPDSGKSLVLQLLQFIVGANNVCHIGVDRMNEPRDLAAIFGKKLNAISEVGSTCRINEKGFKQLVSCEDSIQIRFLWEEAMSYTPSCKHVICGNTLPDFNDKSGAILNRILILKFPNQISRKRQDPNLFVKLSMEVNGIISWALEGAKRLINNNGIFTECEESESTKNEYGQSQNILYDFIEDNYDRTGNNHDMVKFEAMYGKFLKYMKKNVERNVLTRALFDLGIETKKMQHEGYRGRWVLGIQPVNKSDKTDDMEIDSYSSSSNFGII